MTKWQLVSNKYISWVLKVSNRKYYCVVKHFAFLKNICYQYLNFVLAVTDCFFFTNCWLADSQLSWNVLLFSCNPYVQLGQDGPITDSSRTVTGQTKVAMIIIWAHGGYVEGSGVGGGGGVMVPLKFTKWSLDIVSPFLPATTTCDPSFEVLKEVKPPSTW